MNKQRYEIKYLEGADTHQVIDTTDGSVIQTCGYEEALTAMNALQGVEDLPYGPDFEDKKTAPVDFSDLENPDDWNGTADVKPVDVHTGLNAATVARFEEDCKACRGSGNFFSYTGRLVGPCFKCKGKGKRYFKTSPEVRAEQSRRRVEKKKEIANAKIEQGKQWLIDNPAEAEYLKVESEKGNDFAVSMLTGLGKFGSLTENMLNGIKKGMARKAEWAEKNAQESKQRDERTADAELDLTGLLNAFAAAVANGLKAPKLTVGNLYITRAKDTSRNPGYLYVSTVGSYEDRTYLGKISPAGEFFAGRDCTDEIFNDVKKLSGDVLKAAQAHGALTGNCSMCNRLLTNELSVQLGIGPICRANWGL